MGVRMRSTTILVFGLLMALNCFANDGPAISEMSVTSKYPGKFKSINQVNFKEFTISIKGKPFRLHQGTFKKFSHGTGGVEIELVNSWVIPSSQGNPKLALIFFVQTLIGGSISKTGFVQLLAVENSQMVIKQEFRFIPLEIPHVCEFDPINGELSIIAKSDDPSPIFAPEYADHAVYRLTGERLERTAWKTVSTKLP